MEFYCTLMALKLCIVLKSFGLSCCNSYKTPRSSVFCCFRKTLFGHLLMGKQSLMKVSHQIDHVGYRNWNLQL